MPDNPQVQDWDKLCSKALKLCFDAMCDTALVFFWHIQSYNFDSFEKKSLTANVLNSN